MALRHNSKSNQLHALLDTDIRSPSYRTVISGNSRFWVTNQQEGPPKGTFPDVTFRHQPTRYTRPTAVGVSRLHGSFRSATTQEIFEVRFLRFVTPNPL